MSLSLFALKKPRQQEAPVADGIKPTPTPYEPAQNIQLDDDPLKRLLQQERFGCIVRQPQLFEAHPHLETLFQSAVEAIDDRFALVPEGYVTLPKTVNDYPGCPEEDIDTNAFLLRAAALPMPSSRHLSMMAVMRILTCGPKRSCRIWLISGI